MKTSIVILSYNKMDYTRQCIESIRRYTERGTYEIIAVDNASTDSTVEWLKEQPEIIKILNKENLGFPKGCNQGILAASGDNILLLNNDTVVTHNWLSNLLNCLYSSEDIGCVGPLTNYCSNNQAINITYKTIPEMHNFAKQFNIPDSSKWKDRLKLIGFCLLIKKEVVDKVGLLDELFSPGNYEDDDYCLRVRAAGYRLVLCKDTFIHHYGSVSFGSNSQNFTNTLDINKKKFESKWKLSSDLLLAIHSDIIDLVANLAASKKINLLQIGCGGGGTLISLKSIFSDSCLYGMEKHGELLINLSRYANVIAGDAVQIEFIYDSCTFDFVVITDDELDQDRLVNVIKKIIPILNKGGCLIVSSVPGKNFEQLLSECFAGYTSVNCMTYESSGRVNLCIKDFETASPVLPQENSGQPLISICIPTYNRAKDLDTCLGSIFSQIGSNSLFEVVVINNASQDNTEEIISKYALSHTNLVHQRNPVNIGPERNYLKALDSANGEYLLLHGDDDFFADGSLSRLLDTVKRNRYKSMIFIDVLHDDKKEVPVKSLDDFIYLEIGTSSAFITSIMLKSSEYHKIEDKEKFLGSELNQVYLLFTIIEGNPNGCVVNDSMFRYASNLSGGYEWPRIFIQSYLELLEYFRSRGSVSAEMIRFEKERMLKQSILKWFVIFSRENRLKQFGMECLDKYLFKYYDCEPYFREFYEIIQAIRSGKIQL